MANFSLDFDLLEKTLTKRSYKLSEVQDKIEKVAFDMVKFKDGNFDQLWRIEDSADGAYIVAVYNDEEEIISTASAKSNFAVIVKNSELNIFYKGEFICKTAAKALGLDANDLGLVHKYLPVKLASNKSLRDALFSDKQHILAKYPELA